MAHADLIISEYVEGSGNNKAVELFNGTDAAIQLDLADYLLQVYFNGSNTAGLTVELVGTVNSGGVFVLAHAAAIPAILGVADQRLDANWFNGNDAIVLRKAGTNGSIVDVIGQIGVNPGTEWGTGVVSTADNTLRRKTTVDSGDAIGTDRFDPAAQWLGFAQDTFGDLGRYEGSVASAPVVTITAIDAAASEAGRDPGTVRISRTASTGSALSVSLTLAGSSASASDFVAAPSLTMTIPSGQTFVDVKLTPVDDAIAEGTEALTLTLVDAASYDLGAPASATLVIADNDAGFTRISAIQGTGQTSPLVGQIVTVEAVVVGDFQDGGFNGFYLQEEAGDQDANALTSEGLFVYQGGHRVHVQPGDVVRVTGVVGEFDTADSSLSELHSVSSVVVVKSGGPLPAATTLTFPLSSVDVLEAHEGMLVAIASTLVVTSTLGLGPYGEVLLSSGGPGNQPGTDARLDAYTQFNLPSVQGFSAYQASIAARRIVLDDGRSDLNPESNLYGRGGQSLSASNTLRGGDTASGIVGILDDRYGSADTGQYRIQPTQPVAFVDTNPRPPPPELYGNLRVASFNAHNLFNGDGNAGGFPTERGADDPVEYQRQLDKLVQAILGLDADVVGLMEIENDGYGSTSAIDDFVGVLNAVAGPGIYALVDPGRSAVGSDAITVGLIYRPAVLRLHGGAAILDSQFVDPDGGGFDSSVQRPSLAQSFELVANGAVFTAVFNHLKSKVSSAAGIGDADAGDGQGPSNGTRTRAADTLMDWLATDPTHSSDPDVIILGDLNAYAMEDPVGAIRAGADNRAGTADDFADILPSDAYSYGFAGQWGALDHALGSSSLARQVTGAQVWPINADEPEVLGYDLDDKSTAQRAQLYAADALRSSDHDPVVVSLALGFTGRALVGNADDDQFDGTGLDDFLAGAGGDDILDGKAGNDHLDGGPGIDLAVFAARRDDASLGATSEGMTIASVFDGHDILIDVERLAFNDVSVAFDLGGHAGIVARILGAVFGKEAVRNETYAGIGLHFLDDGSFDYVSLTELAITARLAGVVSNLAVVELLWANVVKQPLPSTEREYFVGLLDRGEYTIGALGRLAADTELNAANIDLVGLAQTGLGYLPFHAD